MRYPKEVLGENDDDGTMPSNVDKLTNAVVGHRIVKTERVGYELNITLDSGAKVRLTDTYDCCAHTELESFLLNPELVDHIITGVGTTDGFTVWHIYADMGDVLQLNVDWNCGNPFYYGYGFSIVIK